MAQVLFLGMRGSGKSTELNALAASLRDRFEVVRFEADVRLNATDFDVTELLLAIVVEVERHMREHVQRPVDEALLARIQDWFSTVTHENVKERVAAFQVGAEAKVPGPAAFFGSLMGMLKSSNAAREKVVAALRRFPGELVTLCNHLLRAAEAKLEDARELLVMVDNLDRYSAEVVDGALGASADHVRALEVSMLLTPPVDLLVRPRSQPLSNLYPSEFMHVPAIRKPDDSPGTLRDPGHGLLLELLAKRFAVSDLLEDGVADALIRLSGGNPRPLLELTREALLRRPDGAARLGLQSVELAVRGRLTLLRDQVNHSGLVALIVAVDTRGQIGVDSGYLELLYRRWVYKHDGQDWYSVNPLVRMVPEVQAAMSGTGG